MLPGARVVYYCVDDFTKWPGFDIELVREMEHHLIQRADVIVAASPKLRDRLAKWGKPVHLLTHGVDFDHFGSSVLVEHHCLAGIRKPRVGFFGLVDSRMDQQLLCDVAKRMPEVSFVLAGPVQASVRQLTMCGNIHLPGPIPYLELPAFVSGMDVLCVPYKSGHLGDSLSPLKLKEYLVTGKPITARAHRLRTGTRTVTT